MYYCICTNERIPIHAFSSKSRLLRKLMIYMAFDMPIVQATPIPQPVVLMRGVVREESGCTCCLKATTRPKTTKKPIKDKVKLAWITFGTRRGPRKRGKTVLALIRSLFYWCQKYLQVRITVARYIKYSCDCVAWKVVSQNDAIPETDATTTETPEQVAMVQPKRFIQPTKKAANFL